MAARPLLSASVLPEPFFPTVASPGPPVVADRVGAAVGADVLLGGGGDESVGSTFVLAVAPDVLGVDGLDAGALGVCALEDDAVAAGVGGVAAGGADLSVAVRAAAGVSSFGSFGGAGGVDLPVGDGGADAGDGARRAPAVAAGVAGAGLPGADAGPPVCGTGGAEIGFAGALAIFGSSAVGRAGAAAAGFLPGNGGGALLGRAPPFPDADMSSFGRSLRRSGPDVLPSDAFGLSCFAIPSDRFSPGGLPPKRTTIAPPLPCAVRS